MELKGILRILVVLFAAIYYAARVGIFYLGTSGEMQFEEEQSQLEENIVTFSFLAIGVVGLITLPGVYILKPWGFWGTIAVSVYTIAFDIWAYVLVQSSAAAGVIPAAVLLAYILVVRKDYMSGHGR